MDAGPFLQRRETNCRRVSSPRAANRRAGLSNCGTGFGLRSLGKVFFDQLHDHTPTLLVGGERLRPTFQWDSIKAGFGNGEPDAVCRFFNCKENERGRFVRVIGATLGRARVPPKREKPLSFHTVNRDIKIYALGFLLGFCDIGIDCRCLPQLHAHVLPERRAVELHTEPQTKLF